MGDFVQPSGNGSRTLPVVGLDSRVDGDFAPPRDRPTDRPLNLSLHLCARAAQKTIRGDWEAQSEYRDIFADFQRFQLNADYAKSRKYLPNLPTALRELSPTGQFIVQLTGEPLNEEVAQNLVDAGLDVAFLFDGS